MKKSLLALACAVAALAPLAVVHAQDVTLSTSNASPTLLTVGEVGTASPGGENAGSFIDSSGVADYFFQFQAPVSEATSFLGNLDLTSSGPISSSVISVAGTTLTEASVDEFGSTTFNITPGTKYELAVTGAPGVEFVANVSTASVSAAPEPAAWTLMMLGIGAIGVAMRRSRRAAVSGLVMV